LRSNVFRHCIAIRAIDVWEFALQNPDLVGVFHFGRWIPHRALCGFAMTAAVCSKRHSRSDKEVLVDCIRILV
jgi:hypothetical protein